MSSERGRERTRRRREERGRGGVGPPGIGPDGPFGLLWEDDADDATATAGRRGGRRPRGGGLSRDEIVATGLRIADAEGPEAVSMRRIASELGVGTMSLYHHVRTKDDLLDLMHDVVMGELVIPDDELPTDWRAALAEISRRTKAVYERHEWMVSGAYERPQMGPRAFAHVEQSLSVFHAYPDLPLDLIGAFLAAADDYVIGFVCRAHATRRALQRSSMTIDEYRQALEPYVHRLIAGGDYPNLARFFDEEWRPDDDTRFEQGLQWLLDGIERRLEVRS